MRSARKARGAAEVLEQPQLMDTCVRNGFGTRHSSSRMRRGRVPSSTRASHHRPGRRRGERCQGESVAAQPAGRTTSAAHSPPDRGSSVARFARAERARAAHRLLAQPPSSSHRPRRRCPATRRRPSFSSTLTCAESTGTTRSRTTARCSARRRRPRALRAPGSARPLSRLAARIRLRHVPRALLAQARRRALSSARPVPTQVLPQELAPMPGPCPSQPLVRRAGACPGLSLGLSPQGLSPRRSPSSRPDSGTLLSPRTYSCTSPTSVAPEPTPRLALTLTRAEPEPNRTEPDEPNRTEPNRTRTLAPEPTPRPGPGDAIVVMDAHGVSHVVRVPALAEGTHTFAAALPADGGWSDRRTSSRRQSSSTRCSAAGWSIAYTTSTLAAWLPREQGAFLASLLEQSTDSAHRSRVGVDFTLLVRSS